MLGDFNLPQIKKYSTYIGGERGFFENGSNAVILFGTITFNKRKLSAIRSD